MTGREQGVQVEARTLSGVHIGMAAEAGGSAFVIAEISHTRTRTTLWPAVGRFQQLKPTDLVTLTGGGAS